MLTSPSDVVEQMLEAMNSHNLDAFVACFAEDYDSRHPVHPDRTFVGNVQVRRNWTGMFGGVPDFHADLVRTAVSGDTVWTQWAWSGTRLDGEPFAMAGVIIFGVKQNRFSWADFFMESVEQGGKGIDASVRSFVSGS